MTSSPGPMPREATAVWRAEVPLEVEMANLAPFQSAHFFSNSMPRGPVQ